MKASIEEGCIACGLCPATCPEVFRMGENDLAEVFVDVVPSEAEATAVEAQEGCPVSVISVN